MGHHEVTQWDAHAQDRSEFRQIGDSTYIHNKAQVSSGVRFGARCIVEEFCVVGRPYRSKRRADLLRNQDSYSGEKPVTQLDDDVYLSSFSLIGEGAHLAEGVVIGDYCRVGERSVIGKQTKLQYGAKIFKRVNIGEECRIGGFVCNDARIGNRCTIYGALVHQYRTHGGEKGSASPTIEDDVIVAFNSLVIGGVVLGKGSYIMPGAVVTRSIRPGALVGGINQVSENLGYR